MRRLQRIRIQRLPYSQYTHSLHFNIPAWHRLASKILYLSNVSLFGLDVYLTNDSVMRKLNHQYRGKDWTTDVLSFPLQEIQKPGHLVEPPRMVRRLWKLGDVYLCVDDVLRWTKEDLDETTGVSKHTRKDGGIGGYLVPECLDNVNWNLLRLRGSRQLETELQKRLAVVLVHGITHLTGFDHETKKDFMKMRSVEEKLLRDYVTMQM